jgi:heme exporter protein D
MSFPGMSLGPHADFIIAAYAVAVIIVATIVIWVVIDYRHQQRMLADLESRGVTRRSAAGEGVRS